MDSPHNDQTHSPRKLQHTPISHTPKRQSAGIANYERNPGLQYSLVIKGARAVLKNNFRDSNKEALQ